MKTTVWSKSNFPESDIYFCKDDIETYVSFPQTETKRERTD